MFETCQLRKTVKGDGECQLKRSFYYKTNIVILTCTSDQALFTLTLMQNIFTPFNR